VVVAPEALAELVQISAWWNVHRRAAPRLFQRELDELLALLADYPDVGTRASSKRVAHARVADLRRSGYRVYYQVRLVAGEVLVVHVRHARRRPLRTRR
jgi:plasmid stabilization system protein ParE